MKSARKSNKKVIFTTTAALLVLASFSVSAYAANNMDAIPKNRLMTETTPALNQPASSPAANGQLQSVTQTTPTNSPLTEAQALEIGKQALSSMIGVDVSRLKPDAVMLGQYPLEHTIYGKPVWQLNWISPLDKSDVAKAASQPELITSGQFELHTITLDAANGEVLSIRSDGVSGSSTTIQDLSDETVKHLVLEFIEKNGLAAGTSVADIQVYDFFKKASLAKLKLANGKQASVVLSKLSGTVIGYEGDVAESSYDVDEILKKMAIRQQ